MRIKSKLALGLGFLFCMIITLVVLSIFYVNRVSNDTDVILKDNYITLRYCNDLLADLDRLSGDTSVMAHFDEILTKQEGNITEPGEGEATRRLRYHFEEIKKTRRIPPFMMMRGGTSLPSTSSTRKPFIRRTLKRSKRQKQLRVG